MLLVEDYRPQNLDEIVLPADIKRQINEWIETDIPHLLLTSKVPGTGKSTLARILIRETQAEALFLNASLYPNIDTLRYKIQGFVSTTGFNDAKKIVVLDEADALNPNSTQPALRGFIEEFSGNARFILTCNYPDKIIEPIRNRLVTLDFDKIFRDYKKELAKEIYGYLTRILSDLEIRYSKEDIAGVIKESYPSIRDMVQKIQKGIQGNVFEFRPEKTDIKELFLKSYQELLEYVVSNPDPERLYNQIFKNIEIFGTDEAVAEAVMTLAEYQYKSSRVRDVAINTMACLLELQSIYEKGNR